MDSLELVIKGESYKVIRDKARRDMYSVFNHVMCHTIKKKENGEWEAVEHRFGTEYLPLNEIGYELDKHYYQKFRLKFMDN